jgi:hypothetical protein
VDNDNSATQKYSNKKNVLGLKKRQRKLLFVGNHKLKAVWYAGQFSEANLKQSK